MGVFGPGRRFKSPLTDHCFQGLEQHFWIAAIAANMGHNHNADTAALSRKHSTMKRLALGFGLLLFLLIQPRNERARQ